VAPHGGNVFNGVVVSKPHLGALNGRTRFRSWRRRFRASPCRFVILQLPGPLYVNISSSPRVLSI